MSTIQMPRGRSVAGKGRRDAAREANRRARRTRPLGEGQAAQIAQQQADRAARAAERAAQRRHETTRQSRGMRSQALLAHIQRGGKLSKEQYDSFMSEGGDGAAARPQLPPASAAVQTGRMSRGDERYYRGLGIRVGTPHEAADRLKFRQLDIERKKLIAKKTKPAGKYSATLPISLGKDWKAYGERSAGKVVGKRPTFNELVLGPAAGPAPTPIAGQSATHEAPRFGGPAAGYTPEQQERLYREAQGIAAGAGVLPPAQQEQAAREAQYGYQGQSPADQAEMQRRIAANQQQDAAGRSLGQAQALLAQGQAEQAINRQFPLPPPAAPGDLVGQGPITSFQPPGGPATTGVDGGAPLPGPAIAAPVAPVVAPAAPAAPTPGTVEYTGYGPGFAMSPTESQAYATFLGGMGNLSPQEIQQRMAQIRQAIPGQEGGVQQGVRYVPPPQAGSVNIDGVPYAIPNVYAGQGAVASEAAERLRRQQLAAGAVQPGVLTGAPPPTAAQATMEADLAKLTLPSVPAPGAGPGVPAAGSSLFGASPFQTERERQQLVLGEGEIKKQAKEIERLGRPGDPAFEQAQVGLAKRYEGLEDMHPGWESRVSDSDVTDMRELLTLVTARLAEEPDPHTAALHLKQTALWREIRNVEDQAVHYEAWYTAPTRFFGGTLLDKDNRREYHRLNAQLRELIDRYAAMPVAPAGG